MDEFVRFFEDRGEELLSLRDPMVAMSVGAELNAPFLSISDLRGRARAMVLEVVADSGSTGALAALLALAAASDGDIGELAARAAAGMGGGRVPEPSWARAARRPVRTCRVDVLTDRDDPRVQALLVTVVGAGAHAAFVLRFHIGSALTEQILFVPGAKRADALRSLETGSDATGSHRYSPPTEFTGDLVALVNSITVENELNLRRGGRAPLYPPSLAQVDRIDSLTLVPALLVLLRKFVGSAACIEDWCFSGRANLWC